MQLFEGFVPLPGLGEAAAQCLPAPARCQLLPWTCQDEDGLSDQRHNPFLLVILQGLEDCNGEKQSRNETHLSAETARRACHPGTYSRKVLSLSHPGTGQLQPQPSFWPYKLSPFPLRKVNAPCPTGRGPTPRCPHSQLQISWIFLSLWSLQCCAARPRHKAAVRSLQGAPQAHLHGDPVRGGTLGTLGLAKADKRGTLGAVAHR